MSLDKKENKVDDMNPNPKMTPEQKKSTKKKQIIGICVVSALLVIAIVMTVLAWTVFRK